MAAEQIDYKEAGRKIAREYLSKRGWARERRRGLERQLNPAFTREAFEEKQRECDRMEEEAEAFISSQYEELRHSSDPAAPDVTAGIYELMGKRNDLGFFAKRIVDRIGRTPNL
jgi:hypothetical protein